jgi:hypothetical protein
VVRRSAIKGGVSISTIKLSMAIIACALICLVGTTMAFPEYDWLSPGGAATVHYSYWGHPTAYYNTWYYPAPVYHYAWYTPVYYNDFDPWWATNVYGPVTTRYYWHSWGW